MLFKPTFWLNSVLMIDEDFLRENRVEALVLDLDNTLSMHGDPVPEEGVEDWLDKMRGLGIKMRVVSNNTNRRVAPLAARLGLEFTANGAKPLTFGITRAMKAMGGQKRYAGRWRSDIHGYRSGKFKGSADSACRAVSPGKDLDFPLKKAAGKRSVPQRLF